MTQQGLKESQVAISIFMILLAEANYRREPPSGN